MDRSKTDSTNRREKVRERSKARTHGSAWNPDHSLRPARSRRASSSPKALPVRPKKHAGWAFVLKLALVIAALALVSYYMLTSPTFMVQHIHIDGIQTIKPSTVDDQVSLPHHTNIFVFVSEHHKEICERIAGANPAIHDADLGIELPNTVVLHIHERQPYVVLHLQNGNSYLMDSYRVAFKKIAPNQSDLPILTVPSSGQTVVEGAELPTDLDNHVQAAYNLVTLLSNRQIGDLTGFREVIVDPNNNVSLKLDTGLLIKLGQADGLPDRLTALETALVAQPSLVSTAEYLDFTTNRYAIMKKAAPLTSLDGNEQPSGQLAPLSTSIGN